jgi:hypothetical protein
MGDFHSTRGKNIEVFWRHIFAQLKQWSYDRQIPIDTSIYLEQEMIKAIVKLCFNPGQRVAHLMLASKGLSILACRACTTAETKRVRKQEQVLSAMEKTRQLDELLRLSKGTTGAPANKFWELKANVAMFMSLVWVLFGTDCDYYCSLQKSTPCLNTRRSTLSRQNSPPGIVVISRR